MLSKILLVAFIIGQLSACTSMIKDKEISGAVYSATNKTTGNTLVGFVQNNDGSLKKIGEYSTNGKGTGNVEIFEGSKNDPTEPLADGVDPLISAYGVFSALEGKVILAVNAGDSSVSSMKVAKDYSLRMVSKVKASDKYPVSIASHKNIVYVASSGKKASPPFSGSITGYNLSNEGTMTAIPNSTRDLGARPTALAFTDDGNFLVVAELVTGLVKVYKVSGSNISKQPVAMVSSPHNAKNDRWLPIPVGFDIVANENGYSVFVSEARFLNNMGQLEKDSTHSIPQARKYKWQTGSTSSYHIDYKGNIKLVSGDVLTGESYTKGQIANCWVEVSPDGKNLWAANALSSSLSSYTIGKNGSLTLLNEIAFKEKSQELFFSDLYVSKDGRFLNQLIGNKGEIMTFEILEGNKLKHISTTDGLPEIGAYGLITI